MSGPEQLGHCCSSKRIVQMLQIMLSIVPTRSRILRYTSWHLQIIIYPLLALQRAAVVKPGQRRAAQRDPPLGPAPSLWESYRACSLSCASCTACALRHSFQSQVCTPGMTDCVACGHSGLLCIGCAHALSPMNIYSYHGISQRVLIMAEGPRT